MIWSPIVTILAVTVLLCGCGSTVSPAAGSSLARESALPESMEYLSEVPAPETASESLPEITVKPELLTDAKIEYYELINLLDPSFYYLLSSIHGYKSRLNYCLYGY